MELLTNNQEMKLIAFLMLLSNDNLLRAWGNLLKLMRALGTYTSAILPAKIKTNSLLNKQKIKRKSPRARIYRTSGVAVWCRGRGAEGEEVKNLTHGLSIAALCSQFTLHFLLSQTGLHVLTKVRGS